ncbi:oxidoreductase [Saccharopolyspora terrae]|uniref:Oxidoreductase n=1 Tax=Saccharopolyspora terrae TaxID=2530384 RepID=A0A4R4VCZ4_9PSEU|nr:PDR/VanB family oxidoreductase [Saccharopolyspora terrae]TDD03329.1 oxidoreductase [Saccharopolyspora terrae]
MTAPEKAAAVQNTTHPMSVTARRELSDGVVELELTHVDGHTIEWEPGAHLDVVLSSGLVRQYSICGGEGHRGVVRIAVLREEEGRGGSREVHENLHPGTEIGIRGPRNHFRLVEADRYLFIAGGIGITPILAMIDQVTRQRLPWTLLYGGRNRRSMAYVDELTRFRGSAASSAEVIVVPEDEEGRPDLRTALTDLEASTAVYACGPEPLLVALEELAEELLEPGQLHLERFGAAQSAVDTTGDGGLDSFEVELASTGEVLQVGPDDRLIDVVRTVEPQVPFSCEEGYCGSCETGVLKGLPCHRDQVLSDEEREQNDTMMICVGRSRTERLTLDL